MDGVGEDGVNKVGGEVGAVVGEGVVVVAVGVAVEPVDGELVLGGGGVDGVDEEVAIGGGGDHVAPVAVGELRAVVVGADALEEVLPGVEFEGLFDIGGGVEEAGVGGEGAFEVEAEGDDVPGPGLGLVEVGIHGDDGALFAGVAEAGLDGRDGADSGEVDEGVAGDGVA